MDTILLDHLSKTYPGGKQALKGISLSLGEGEVFGFLGPNGAGKTTTVKLLTGILSPTQGHCQVMGTDPSREPEKTHGKTGVVTEHARMYDHLTGLENLLFYASISGISPGEGKDRAMSLLSRLGLEESAKQKLSAYSTGMRQRLSLARALIHRPQVLFLDEPTSGLDPESAKQVNSLIKTLAAKEGVTVFLCTHQLRYAQELCTRYGLLEEGSLLALGTLEELQKKVLQRPVLQITARQVPESLPFKKTGDLSYETEISSEEEIPVLLRQIIESGGELYAAQSRYPTLEDIYFSLTSKKEAQP